MAWSALVDMEMSDEEKLDTVMPIPTDRPDYPWGLRISLTEKELEKLGLDHDVDVGDLIDMRAFGVVTSVSKNDGPEGPCCRVEIQLQRMAVENEMTEEEAEIGEIPTPSKRRASLYD